MVYIHSTYYIKIHLLCDIRDSIQAAGGVDFSILWPGKLWKTIVFRQIKPAPFREEATIFTIAEKAKINSSFTLSVQCRIVSQARRNPPFYIRTEAKRTPHIWGPCKHPDRRSTVIPQRIIRRNRPFFTGLCSGWRTRLWEAKDVFRSSDLHK